MNHYERACAAIGTWEWKDGHNPKIVQYFKDVGHDWVKDDETAWCAAFVGAMLERSGVKSTRALNARSYLEWGEPVALADARCGDVVVFSRGNPNGWQGHVAFFERDNGSTLTVLGGNQSNQVNLSKYAKDRLLGIRRASDLSVAPSAPPAREVQQNNGWGAVVAAFLRSLVGVRHE